MTSFAQKSCSDGKQVEAAMMAKKLARENAKSIDDQDVLDVIERTKEPETKPTDNGNGQKDS